MARYLFTLLFLFGFMISNGQTGKYFDKIKDSFDKKNKQALEDAYGKIKKAQKDFESGVKLFSSKQTSKALSKAESSASVFRENYRIIFTVYEDKLSGMINETEGDKQAYLTKLMQDAKSNFRLSIYNRLKAGEVKDEKESFELYKAAHEKEIEAIDQAATVFALIKGWETADFVVEDEDYNPENSFVNENTEGFTTRSFSVNDPELEQNYKFNRKVVTVSAEGGNNFADNNGEYAYSDNKNSTYNNSVSSNYSGTATGGHEFRIQIGASVLPANEAQIKRMNNTDLDVKVYKSGVYYKYTVGSFKDFREAKNFKNAYGLNGTYIVEYKDGKEVKLYLHDIQ